MGGGKETPRQKMVGLMYLVLMALLAMNVSKAVLDAFIAIEDNIQKSCMKQLDRGNAMISDLKGELADKANPAKVEKVKYFLDICNKIDEETAKRIEAIDKVKIDILTLSGEKVTTAKDNSEEAVLWRAYDKKNPLLPARFNLMAVEAKDQYDIPMHTIIGEDLKNITGIGKDIWKGHNDYRRLVCELVGSYKAGPNNWSLKPADINTYKDNEDLAKQVDKMLDKAKINVNDDREILKQLYMELTKPERSDMGEEKNIHWIGKTFDHSPLVAAIASLTSLQQEYLMARATALAHIKSRVTTGEYSFNKVMAIASGPASANSGEEFEVKVMMAAFDSDNQPTVTVKGGSVKEVKDGIGIVTARASAGPEMTLSGTVSIRKKSGEMKTENWETKVAVLKPQGTVSLPDMNVVYRGYSNRIVGVASGYEETILSGTGITLRKTGNEYIGDPGTGKTCSIVVSGRNKAANKTVQLGKFDFKVSNLPSPGIFLGNLANGASASKSAIASMTNIITKYPPEIALNVSFQTLKWDLSVSGAPRSFSGNGSSLSPEATALLKQAKPGAKVSLIVTYKKPNGGTALSACSISVQ